MGTTAVDTRGDDTSRLDRELLELLNELRVALPGVQALFAFLLIVPFTERFTQVSEVERLVYLVAFLASALSCILLVSPTSFHRLRFRQLDKELLLRVGNRATIAGLAMLAVAMGSAVFLVSGFLYATATAVGLTSAVMVALGILWWALPLARRADVAERPGTEAD